MSTARRVFVSFTLTLLTIILATPINSFFSLRSDFWILGMIVFVITIWAILCGVAFSIIFTIKWVEEVKQRLNLKSFILLFSVCWMLLSFTHIDKRLFPSNIDTLTFLIINTFVSLTVAAVLVHCKPREGAATK